MAGNAKIWDRAELCGDTIVWGNAQLYDSAKVSGDVELYGSAQVCGDAEVSNNEDIFIFKNYWSSGRHFTYTKSNKMWKVGCFYGTGQELIEKAYSDSKTSGTFYKAYVDFAESLEQIKEENGF